MHKNIRKRDQHMARLVKSRKDAQLVGTVNKKLKRKNEHASEGKSSVAPSNEATKLLEKIAPQPSFPLGFAVIRTALPFRGRTRKRNGYEAF
jgi:hypothetical protein